MPQSTDQILVKAKRHAAKGKTVLAAQLYQLVLQQFPDNKRAIHGLKSLNKLSNSTPSGQLQKSIERLLKLYNMDRFEEALIQGEELAKKYPGVIKLHNILGVVNLKLRRLDEAEKNFSNLLKLDSGNAEGHNNLGVVLLECGRYKEAASSYRYAIRIQPDFAQAHNNLGTVLSLLELHEDAINNFVEALRIKPDYAEAHSKLGNLYRDQENHEQAISCYTQALKIESKDSNTTIYLGKLLNKLGRYEEAIKWQRKAIALQPDFASAHSILAAAFYGLQQYKSAITSYDETLRINPNAVDAYNNRGIIQQFLNQTEQAIASYSSAIQIKPDYVTAHSNLCELFEKKSRLNDLETALEKARKHCGDQDPTILLRRAQLTSRRNEHTQTLALLLQITPTNLTQVLQALYFSLLGKTYDKLNLCQQAYLQFERMNAVISTSAPTQERDADLFLNDTLRLNQQWSDKTRLKLRASQAIEDDTRLAFLVGFPRSGTTLLDTILRSHPAINVIEEQGLVDKMQSQLGQLPAPSILTSLAPGTLEQLRDGYRRNLTEYLDDIPSDGIIIDKYPLAMQNIGLIHCVFPKAKIILALRHPCDCVLSCFMQNFELNNAMSNFQSLQRSAKLYVAIMQLWQSYCQRLSLDVSVLKYENLVGDIKSTCLPVIEFLGLNWDDDLLNYQATASKRDAIHTPSYNQVTQPLYQQASGRWQRYTEQLEPVLPLLKPWIEKYGY